MRTSNWPNKIWILFLIPALVLIAARWSTPPDFESADYAQYLLHARALAAGRSYGDIGYIYSDHAAYVGPRAYPPGLPVTLWAVQALAGEGTVLIQVTMAAFFLMFVSLACTHLARIDGRIACGVALLTSLSPAYVDSITIVASDFAFAALVWLITTLADRVVTWGPGRILLLLVLSGVAIGFRLVGLALLPALALYAALHVPFTDLRRRIVPLLLGTSLLAALAVALALAPSSFRPLGAAPELNRALPHLLRYRVAVFELAQYPFRADLLNDVYHAGALALIALGLGHFFLHRRSRFLLAFASTYTAMLLLAPVFAPRYAWPLFPLLAFALLHGLTLVIDRLLPDSLSRHSPALAVFLAAAVSLSTTIQRASNVHTLPTIDHPQLQSLFAHLGAAPGRTTMRVVFVKPRVLTLRTGIPAMATFVAPPEVIESEMERQGITHIILGDLGLKPAEEAAWRAMVELRRDRFHLEYQNPSFVLLRLGDGPTGLPGKASQP